MRLSELVHWHAYDWALAAALAVAAWLYWTQSRRRATRAWLFWAGWFVLAAALLSPLDAAAERWFWVHMVQHELLMLVAAPLFVLAGPLGALPRRWRRRAAQILRISPLAAWALHAAAIWLWHVPTLFQAAVQSEWMHAAQHASFFATALLFWWTVFRRAPSGVAVLSVATTMIHTAVLGALLTFAPVPLYAGYALEDQQLGGLIMWVPAGFVMLAAGLWVFNRWLGYQT